MNYHYVQWGVTVALLVSVILNINADAKKRELNQRYEKLIEQKEESYKYTIKIIKELERYVARKKQKNEAP